MAPLLAEHCWLPAASGSIGLFVWIGSLFDSVTRATMIEQGEVLIDVNAIGTEDYRRTGLVSCPKG